MTRRGLSLICRAHDPPNNKSGVELIDPISNKKAAIQLYCCHAIRACGSNDYNEMGDALEAALNTFNDLVDDLEALNELINGVEFIDE